MSTEAAGAPAADRSITFSAPDTPLSLAGPVLIRVRYANRTGRTMEFREPAKTWEVKLSIRKGPEGIDVPFGQIKRMVSTGKVRRVIEKAETITLQPGASFEFQYDAGARWPERFFLGRQTLQVKDLMQEPEIESNAVVIRVEYTAASFPLLLAIVESPDRTDEAKGIAAGWIKRLYPGFENTPDSVERAGAWWQLNQGSPAIQSILDKLNRGADSQ